MVRGEYEVGAVFDAADDVGIVSELQCVRHLRSSDPAIRYWGAMGLTTSSQLNEASVSALRRVLHDNDLSVRIQACDALARHGFGDDALPVLANLLTHEDLTVVLHASRAVELCAESAGSLIPNMRFAKERAVRIQASDAAPSDKDMAMFIEFSTNAFLTTNGVVESKE